MHVHMLHSLPFLENYTRNLVSGDDRALKYAGFFIGIVQWMF